MDASTPPPVYSYPILNLSSKLSIGSGLHLNNPVGAYYKAVDSNQYYI